MNKNSLREIVVNISASFGVGVILSFVGENHLYALVSFFVLGWMFYMVTYYVMRKRKVSVEETASSNERSQKRDFTVSFEASPRYGFKGRDKKLAEVLDFCKEKKKEGIAPFVWVWGAGGIGKTEFCRAVCRKLTEEHIADGKRMFISMGNIISLDGFYTQVIKVTDPELLGITKADFEKVSLAQLGAICKGGIAYFDDIEDVISDLKDKEEARIRFVQWLLDLHSKGVIVVVSSRATRAIPKELISKSSGVHVLQLGKLLPADAQALFCAVLAQDVKVPKNLDGHPLAIILTAQAMRKRGNGGGEISNVSLSGCLKKSWDAFKNDKHFEAIELWGLFYWSVTPISNAMMVELLGKRKQLAASEILKGSGLIDVVEIDGKTYFTMLDPIKDTFHELSKDEKSWRRTWWGSRCQLNEKVLFLWVSFLNKCLPPLLRQGAAFSWRPCCEKMPQVYKILGGMMHVVGKEKDVADLMYAVADVFPHDMRSLCVLEKLCAFFEEKTKKKGGKRWGRDWAFALACLGRVQQACGHLEDAKKSLNDAKECYNGLDSAVYDKDRNHNRDIDIADVLVKLGDVFRECGDTDEALKTLEDAQKRYGENRYGKANALLNIGKVLRIRGETKKAIEKLQSAQSEYEAIGDHGGVADVLLAIGDAQRIQGETEPVQRTLKEALEIYKRMGSKRGEADVLRCRGDAKRICGDIKGAETDLTNALKLYKEMGDLHGEANAMRSIGDLDRMRGAFDDALENLNKANNLYETTGDRHGKANALRSMGDVLRILAKGDAHQYDYAVKNLEAALNLHEQSGDNHGIADVYRCLGDLWREKKDFAQANEMLKKALDLYTKIGDLHGKVRVLLGIGQVKWDRGLIEAAGSQFKEAFSICILTGDLLGKAHVLLNKGLLLCACGNHVDAKKAFKSAREIYVDMGYEYNIQRVDGCLKVVNDALQQKQQQDRSAQT